MCRRRMRPERQHSVGRFAKRGEQTMFSGEKLVSRWEISLVIAVCGVLFFLTFANGGDPLWSVPAMTLFFATGMAFLYALVSWRWRQPYGPASGFRGTLRLR